MGNFRLPSLIGLVLCFLISCEQKPQNTYIDVDTDFGRVVLLLYEETPVHTANFVKLAEEGFFDGVAFHRIISGFMVQSGDPSTKDNPTTEGNGPGYTLVAEFSDQLIHTTGKLGAAREPDAKNPEKRSSGSQFYVVTGKSVSEEDLDELEASWNQAEMDLLYKEFLTIEQDEAAPIDFDLFLAHKNYQSKTYYTEEMRAHYLRTGGAPHLDFQYTIFGEVVIGMEIIQAIERLPTSGERPLKAVKIQSMKVRKSE